MKKEIKVEKKEKQKSHGNFDKLSACKVCGSEYRFFSYYYTWFMVRKIAIYCEDCKYETGYYFKPIDAIKKWSRGL